MATMCVLQGCTRPAWIGAGVVHKYCGRTHAAQDLGWHLKEPHGYCHRCNLEGCNQTVYFDEAAGRVHDFCSKGHADEAIEDGDWQPSNKRRTANSPQQRCSLPGCAAPRYNDQSTGHLHDFCGRSHALLAKQRGLVGLAAGPPIAQYLPQAVERVFGGTGRDDYSVAVLTRQHPKYEGIKEQFLDRWVHPGPKPRVRRLLQVRNTQTVYNQYQAYLGTQVRQGYQTEHRRFHGTSLSPQCSFGIDMASTLCTQNDCAVCGICRYGFDIDRQGASGSLRLALRYGVGHYFSRTSSKSNDYAGASERQSAGQRTRLMFLCKVAPGPSFEAKEISMSDDDLAEQVHGRGYTSVEAKNTAEGGPLNHDELVIYQNEAAIPSYLIVYELQ
ncbi:unnamed protein product [Polarella glacialis]|uniref:PARP catalytic domain-containing protein n=1 Tax=Polarella glacialis TaxID=89957 RepID=A0A813HUZ3_POLGL|nr:unnamed protein product [Polarella glacialis]CAE8645424.1 unnamed protein product [Polarella glacialis]